MFSTVVTLYRKIGCPSIGAGQRIEANVANDSELQSLRDAISELDEELGDYNFIDSADGRSVTIEAVLPSGRYRFFDSVSNFIRLTPSLSKGVVRENYYIRDIDYASTDGTGNVPEKIKNIKMASDFIAALRRFSSAVSNSEELREIDKIFLLQTAGSSRKTVVIPLKFSEEFADLEVSGFKILERLSAPEYRDKLHIEERQLIMAVSISDVVKEVPDDGDAILYIAKNWREVITKYRHDLSAYVRNFAFEAERKKIADAAIEYSAKLNSSLSDMAAKILAAPISIAVILALSKVPSSLDYWAGVVGILIAFVVYRLTLKNQERQVYRLTSSYAFILNGLLRKKATFDSSLRKEIENFEKEADDQKNFLNKTIATYWRIAYLPVAAIFVVSIVRYSDYLIDLAEFLQAFAEGLSAANLAD